MDPIHRFEKPALRRPLAIVAFEGWNDACDAATGAVREVLGQFEVTDPFALLDPEEFFDFQEARPIIEIETGGTRALHWPFTRFFAVPLSDHSRDLVIVLGREPHLRWKTFTRHLTKALCESDVEEVLVLGAFLGEVSHTLPVPILGVSTDPDRITGLGMRGTDYQGPTGILSVLMEACRETGIRAANIWAAAPHYLAANPNPAAMAALLDAAGEFLEYEFDTSELRAAAADFTERVNQATAASTEFASYVRELELSERVSPGVDPELSRLLVSEIEAFLREQDRGDGE
jgi:predicted ATP-grasp superfamily ATP-dependent carboligase